MIPQFNEDGNLPEGMHSASWKEIQEKFGSNIYRKRLLRGLESGLNNLKSAGCKQAFLDGSFVSSKRRPNDFDVCWDPEGVDLKKLDSVFHHLENGRKAQKAKYHGEFFPKMHPSGTGEIILEFFQQDRESGDPKGIVILNLEDLN